MIFTTEQVDIAADSLELIDKYNKEAVGGKHRGINGALIIDNDVVAGINIDLTIAAQ